jgi:CMP-N-acetylneuraminic acid synthetase
VKTLAVIPARAGSKRLSGKNLRLLGGIPLVVHTIRAAQASRSLGEIVVSTEDDRIAAVAEQSGARVMRRPAALAEDTVQNNDVLRHVLETIGQPFDVLVLLQPTSPMRRAAHIDACVAAMMEPGCRSAMTVTHVGSHPAKALYLRDGLVTPFTSDADMEARSQTLPEVFRQNGAVYAVGVADFLRENRLYLRPCRGVVASPEDSVDIDSELDLIVAEQLLARRAAEPR